MSRASTGMSGGQRRHVDDGDIDIISSMLITLCNPVYDHSRQRRGDRGQDDVIIESPLAFTASHTRFEWFGYTIIIIIAMGVWPLSLSPSQIVSIASCRPHWDVATKDQHDDDKIVLPTTARPPARNNAVTRRTSMIQKQLAVFWEWRMTTRAPRTKILRRVCVGGVHVVICHSQNSSKPLLCTS